ncbi:phosphoribosylpyrophosphate synthetase, putative, partial [Trypanosoma cruzi]
MRFWLSRSAGIRCLRTVCGKPADGISRGRVFTLQDLAKGGSFFIMTVFCGKYDDGFFVAVKRWFLIILGRKGLLRPVFPLTSRWLGREIATHDREYNRKRIIKPTEKASAAIITDAPLHGWGAVFIPDSGDVKIAGGKWEEESFLIMQSEARAVRLALSAFSAILPSSMDVWVDNTSLQGAANKGSPKSNAMTWELQRIYAFLALAECRYPLPTYGLRKTRRRHITRSCFHTSGLGEGVEVFFIMTVFCGKYDDGFFCSGETVVFDYSREKRFAAASFSPHISGVFCAQKAHVFLLVASARK